MESDFGWDFLVYPCDVTENATGSESEKSFGDGVAGFDAYHEVRRKAIGGVCDLVEVEIVSEKVICDAVNGTLGV